jgi:hypothetical protein
MMHYFKLDRLKIIPLLILSVCVSAGSSLFMKGISPVNNEDGVPQFVNVTHQAGIYFQHINGAVEKKDYIFEAKGGGVGFLDYDNDGWIDLFLVQGSRLDLVNTKNNQSSRLYRNQRDGTFKDVTESAGLEYKFWGMGIGAGDYNSDGNVDLYVTQLGPNVLYRNNGDGTFTDVTEKAGVGDPRWSTSAAFGDFDRDGDLDLYVANYIDAAIDKLPPKSDHCTYLGIAVMCGPRGLQGSSDSFYRNNGDGTFTDISESSGALDRDRLYGLGVVWGDIDNDGDQDVYVGNDATPNLLFVNQGDGTFEELGFLSGLAVNGDGALQASMGVDLADFDNDGLLDVFITHFASDFSTLYRNQGDLNFRDVTGPAGIQGEEWLLVGWGTRFFDVNNDGWKDILHSNGHVYPFLLFTESKEEYAQPGSLYLNMKDGTFATVSDQAGKDFLEKTVSRGVAFGDFDNDGDFDFCVANMNGEPQLFRNDRTDQNHWVMFRTVGTESNRDGIGARIQIRTGELRQIWEIKRTVGIYSVSDPRAHFGLGQFTSIDEVEVRWPSGKTQTFKNLPADQHYLVTESGELLKEEFDSK